MSDDLVSEMMEAFWVDEDDGEGTTDYLAELVSDLPDDDDSGDGGDDGGDSDDDFLAEFMLDADDFLEGLLDE